mgnify:CR=1 FL=1|jgi:hypothetical protein
MVAIVAVVFTACSSGYAVVSSRPHAPYYNRPPAPHAGWIWIDGDYYYRGGRYHYRPGYWHAPRPNHRWSPGGWQRHGKGWYWKKGRWHR